MDALPSRTDLNTNRTASYPRFDSTITYVVISMVIYVMGLVGNVLVFTLMADKKFSFLSYSVYLRFLAVSDTAVLLVLFLTSTMKYLRVFDVIAKNLAICRVWVFTTYTFSMLGPWLVVGLTVDRFYCVAYPLQRNRVCTYKKAVIVCSCLTVLSLVTNIPLTIDVRLSKWSNVECIVSGYFVFYSMFLRVVVRSTLPCLLILIFNVITGIHIQRSSMFRKRFSSTSSSTAVNKQDKSLRPLIVISVLAFVTLVPLSIVEAVLAIVLTTKSSFETVISFVKVWPAVRVLYLFNFGQNFYIMMISSSNYRRIMKNKLKSQAFSNSKSGTVARLSIRGVVASGTAESGSKTSEYTSTVISTLGDGSVSTNVT